MNSIDDEAPKDPRICQPTHQEFTEKDFEGHRAHTVYVGVHMPGGGRRHSHRRHRHHHRDDGDKIPEIERPITPPAQRVQFILGEDIDDGSHESHPLFSEMEELVKEGDEIEWKETARWIKFEEDVEEGGNRWSKPHVATLSLHSLFELRSLILNGTVMLDMEACSLELIADLVCENMVNAGTLPAESREQVRDALLRRHRHQHENYPKRRGDNNMSRLPIIRSLAEIGRNHSSSKMDEQHGLTPAPNSFAGCPSRPPLINDNSGNGKYLSVPGKSASLLSPEAENMVKSPSSQSMMRVTSGTDIGDHRANTHFMRKIPHGAEASNILVGEVDFLEKTLSAFIRLKQASVMGDLTEVPVPTRFLFILLGPPGSHGSFHEIGRAMATLMSDEIFHEVAYRAKKRDHLLAGIDEFLDAVTVLPPGEWDPAIRIEPPAAIPSQEDRKRPPENPKKEEIDEEEEEQRLREESGLSRTGRLFGGLMNDVKRKVPWYISDFKDALSLQCIASWIFLYFACLSPIITFGGLLSQATGKNMAAMESLVSGFVCGMGYGFFSGQPLTILGSTGPVLVFETIVYQFCQDREWDYMSVRLWIGIWIAIILLILVAIDASALVCYITRFTEENFATLIAFIFIYKAVENVILIQTKYPINPKTVYDCVCAPPKASNDSLLEWARYTRSQCLNLNGTLVGGDCTTPEPSNVFLMAVILFLGTFTMSIILKDFKNALFFPSFIRQIISDFSVIIAIFSMSLLDFTVNLPTPKLEVPVEFKPTLPDRGWIIAPFNHNPWWTAVVTIFPALLGTILIFMDQQITSVIINRKENKLKKGCGYHLDLFILAILILVCSIMGLPWFVAATVLSINHVNSLKLESECAAPGEKPQFLGVHEQRATHILIFLTIGCSVFLTPLLSHIPMPVLYGVFLYMGVASLKGLQFFDRLLIIFMPAKYQPDYMFLRQVPLRRVHLFTLIQFACLVVLWLIKSFQRTSILFPLMLVVMIGIRKSLDFLFTRRELKILDDIMPEMVKRQQDDLHRLEDGTGEDNNGHHSDDHQPPQYQTSASATSETSIRIPLANGNIMNVPINITEEVNKTSIWKQVNNEQRGGNETADGRNISSVTPDNLFPEIMSGQITITVPHKRKTNGKSHHSSDKKYKNCRSDFSPTSPDSRLTTMREEEETTSVTTTSEDSSQKQPTTKSDLTKKVGKAIKKEFWSSSKSNSKDKVIASNETTV